MELLEVLPFREPWYSPIRNTTVSLLLIRKLNTYSLGNINHSRFWGSRGFAGVLRDKCPEFVEVNNFHEASVLILMVVLHSLLSVVPGMATLRIIGQWNATWRLSKSQLDQSIARDPTTPGSLARHVYLLFLHHNSLVVHATGVTATTWMLSVSPNSAMSVWDVTSHMSCLSQMCFCLRNDTHEQRANVCGVLTLTISQR